MINWKCNTILSRSLQQVAIILPDPDPQHRLTEPDPDLKNVIFEAIYMLNKPS